MALWAVKATPDTTRITLVTASVHVRPPVSTALDAPKMTHSTLSVTSVHIRGPMNLRALGVALKVLHGVPGATFGQTGGANSLDAASVTIVQAVTGVKTAAAEVAVVATQQASVRNATASALARQVD